MVSGLAVSMRLKKIGLFDSEASLPPSWFESKRNKSVHVSAGRHRIFTVSNIL